MAKRVNSSKAVKGLRLNSRLW